MKRLLVRLSFERADYAVHGGTSRVCILSAEQYPYRHTYLSNQKVKGLKPRYLLSLNGPTKVVP
jgi:hypothetical protein